MKTRNLTKAPKAAPLITVAHLPAGQAVVTINSTVYLATVARLGFTFQKEQAKGGQSYTVLVGGGKARSCSCPAAGWGYASCRHQAAADRLLAAF
jgi:hypothetical protein